MPQERPPRSAYVHWERVSTRWADIDVYGHMNNARYFELIDTVVNNHLATALGGDPAALSVIGVVAEVSCRYFAEVTYPEPVDLGVVVDHIGRSSVAYRVGLFQGADDTARAEGRYVHVYVTETGSGRLPTPIPDEIRTVLAPLVTRPGAP